MRCCRQGFSSHGGYDITFEVSPDCFTIVSGVQYHFLSLEIAILQDDEED